jgi:hypothetical protein
MPDLIVGAERYKIVRKARSDRFPARPKDRQIFERTTPEKDWYHELRHDAESCFWLLIWWAIHLRPDHNEVASKIRHTFWTDLVAPSNAEDDARGGLLTKIVEKNGWLDPVYAPLESLIQSMALHLQVDLHWWDIDKHPKEVGDPSYMHEAFQRHIFNFLVANRDAAFMSQKRHSKNREVEAAGSMTPDLTSAQRWSRYSSQHSSRLKRRYEDLEGEAQVSTQICSYTVPNFLPGRKASEGAV